MILYFYFSILVFFSILTGIIVTILEHKNYIYSLSISKKKRKIDKLLSNHYLFDEELL